MPLKVLSSANQISARGFVDSLIESGRLKPGFRQVLAGRDISEIKHYLLEQKLFNADELAEKLATYYKLPYLSLVGYPVNPAVVKLLPRDVITHYKVLPFELKGLTLSLAITDPTMLQKNAPAALTQLRREKGLEVRLVIVPEGDAKAVLDKVYSAPSEHAHQSTVSHQPTTHQPPAVPAAPSEPSVPPMSAPVISVSRDETAVSSADHPEVLKKVENRGKPIDLRTVTITPEVLNRIPYAVAKKYQLVVFELQQHHGQFEPPMIKVAMVNPDDLHVKEILAYIEQRNRVLIDRYYTDEPSFEAALRLYPEASGVPSTPPTAEERTPVRQPELKTPPPQVEKLVLPAVPPGAEEQPVATPAVVAPPPAAETPPVVPAPVTEKAEPALSAPTGEIMTLSAQDIINRPTEESVKDLARLAERQQASLEDQNLDKLIHQPINSVTDLATVFRSGMIPEIVAGTLFLAIRMRASDVHLESEKEYVRIRYRIDGILNDILKVPSFLHAPLISRIKILSKMKIDESRVPQDGRFDVVLDNRQIDLRVSTLPTVHGEKVVMRLLDKSEGMQTLEQLGVTGYNFDVLIKNINKPYGIILSTGPTGSGKSTTLYSILSRISRPGVNIITLEDPVEYELPGLNQAQVMPQIGFTFAEGLRSVLRQDPNVIMVGEIRDLETAAMSTQAALTGHLVLSTLHTNDASGALPRLIDMGVEPFLITSSLNAVIGQRLVRRICDNCREKVTIPAAVLGRVQKELSDIPSGQLKNLNLDQLVFYHGKGCPNCTDGYRGRIGIYEVMAMSEEIENLAVKKAPASEIQKAAVKEGMITMVQDGLMKALKGLTTVDEVMRVTMTSIKEVPGVIE